VVRHVGLHEELLLVVFWELQREHQSCGEQVQMGWHELQEWDELQGMDEEREELQEWNEKQGMDDCQPCGAGQLQD